MKVNLRILSATIACILSASAYAQIVTYDPTTSAQTTITAQQSVTQTLRQFQQYQAQLQQLQIQIQNSTNPAKFNWNNANAVINNVLSGVNTLNTLQKQAGSMTAFLGKFSNATQYQSTCIGTGGCTSAQLQQINASHYTGSAAQKTANDNMLLNLNAQQQLLQSDASNLTVLQQSAQSSTGQLQALQAANQLAGNQAVQLMQIRALMVSQQAAEATRSETVADQEAQQQASHDAFTTNQLSPSPAYNITSYTGTSQ